MINRGDGVWIFFGPIRLEEAPQHSQVADVHDQRVIAGSALGRIDAAYGVGAGCVGAEAVDGLGGEGDRNGCGEEGVGCFADGG